MSSPARSSRWISAIGKQASDAASRLELEVTSPDRIVTERCTNARRMPQLSPAIPFGKRAMTRRVADRGTARCTLSFSLFKRFVRGTCSRPLLDTRVESVSQSLRFFRRPPSIAKLARLPRRTLRCRSPRCGVIDSPSLKARVHSNSR